MGSVQRTCGFSLTQAHKNSLEKDLSFELKTEDEQEEEEEEEEHEVAVLVEVQENEEKEGDGEGGLMSRSTKEIGEVGACDCDITSLSWTLSYSSPDFVFGLHLLMQDPIKIRLRIEIDR